MDYYLNENNCVDRLYQEWIKYGKIIIAYDFDDTVYDYHKKNRLYTDIIKILQKADTIGAYFIVFTCCAEDKYDFIKDYLKVNNIPFDKINDDVNNISFGGRKIYYNLFLDDRTGLLSAYNILNNTIKKMEEFNNMKNNSYVYPASLLCDFYKISHKEQYPEGTEYVYSTWIPRTSRLNNINEVVSFGFQAFIKKYLIEYFNINFFARKEEDVILEYERFIINCLGNKNPNSEHIRDLHKLGYLPIKIKAIPEGIKVPIKVPMMSIENTKPEFFWLTNYLETLLSNELWMGMTSATLANKYKEILDQYAKETGNEEFTIFQGHDFSMRGMASLSASQISGAGHLLSFVGTDIIPAIMFHEKYYNANIEKELVGVSVPATEHSVMCAYGNNEFESYKRLITEIYPNGIVSIVSDTWDLWKVLNNVIKDLKLEILNRDGKIVVRPDSGDPVKIICGDKDSNILDEQKGVVEILWDIFGGVINEKGYKELDSHIGVIYGDAITLERCENICSQLKEKGFASTNVVFGIGSFTYQYNTRDTFGFALKSTHVVINGEEKKIFKNPSTDKENIKKSLIGRCVVIEQNNTLKVVDDLNISQQNNGRADKLQTIYLDGKLLIDDNLETIRQRLKKG